MIFDFHTHAYPPAIAARTLQTLAKTAGQTPHGDGTRAALEANLAAAGADGAAVLNIVTRPGQETTVNDTAAQNDRFVSGKGKLVYFGSVHPDSPHAIEELSRIKALGLRGVKLHPDYQNFLVDDERMYPIYQAISDLGLVVVFHAGYDPLSPDLVHAPPERCARLLRDFPKMKTVLAHCGGLASYDGVERYLAGRFENLYVDTAFCAGVLDTAQARRIFEMQTEDRILFGSDFPWHETKEELLFLDSMGLEGTMREKILYGNAARLLGLTP